MGLSEPGACPAEVVTKAERISVSTSIKEQRSFDKLRMTKGVFTEPQDGSFCAEGKESHNTPGHGTEILSTFVKT
ncbi:MAG: hypothetical protein K9N35_01570 [Candidatus Marinimicrobia bacterium]|nr:hypothetical protein [Candidatus Neomarinimicrobiota bacterium]